MVIMGFQQSLWEKVEELEAKIQDRLDKHTSFNNQISDYQTQIIKLNKKITELEKQKITLDQGEVLPKREVPKRKEHDQETDCKII